MSFQGLLLGLVCFLCIGIFHPIVVYAEYYFSKKMLAIQADRPIKKKSQAIFLLK